MNVICILLAVGAAPTPPPSLEQTGLYADFAAKRVDAKNLAFSPQYPLWSDGASKRRWVYLPPGTTIDGASTDDWVFPVGTKFWKEFSFDRRVETRFIEKKAKGEWIFATYAWNADESAAPLVSQNGARNHHPIGGGVSHDLPSVDDCQTCHVTTQNDVVLGFSALQLSPDRDPNAVHSEPAIARATTLTTLLESKRLVRYTGPTAPRIVTKSPRMRSALGYLHGNCGGCHRPEDLLSSVGLFLRFNAAHPGPDDLPAMKSTINVVSKYPVSGADVSWRIKPGNAWLSTLVTRMATRDPIGQMPPLGSKLIDHDAVELVRQWIQEELE